ncbi:hypothetical protein BGZ83_011517 [Gryganskiella cystojenkinii]|nr:hypothetical protein BGZ83_011517 [Gryganskiella cystojenkinii]
MGVITRAAARRAKEREEEQRQSSSEKEVVVAMTRDDCRDGNTDLILCTDHASTIIAPESEIGSQSSKPQQQPDSPKTAVKVQVEDRDNRPGGGYDEDRDGRGGVEELEGEVKYDDDGCSDSEINSANPKTDETQGLTLGSDQSRKIRNKKKNQRRKKKLNQAKADGSVMTAAANVDSNDNANESVLDRVKAVFRRSSDAVPRSSLSFTLAPEDADGDFDFKKMNTFVTDVTDYYKARLSPEEQELEPYMHKLLQARIYAMVYYNESFKTFSHIRDYFTNSGNLATVTTDPAKEKSDRLSILRHMLALRYLLVEAEASRVLRFGLTNKELKRLEDLRVFVEELNLNPKDLHAMIEKLEY